VPKRIQRKRIKGWRMPENCVSVARPGIFGNPFTLQMGSAEWALREFRTWVSGKTVNRWPELTERREKLLKRLPELRGKDVACFCKEGAPCHGDVLIELANRGAGCADCGAWDVIDTCPHCHKSFCVNCVEKDKSCCEGEQALPDEITIQQDGNQMVAKTESYITVKTKHLRQFGYTKLTKDDVREQLGKLLRREPLTVIGMFMEDDIVLPEADEKAQEKARTA
jgi:hypothetical protein